MRQPARRRRGREQESVDHLRDVVAPSSLGTDRRWSLTTASGNRCIRCRRSIREREPVVVSDAGIFCGLCGRRHWARQWEDPAAG